MSGSSEIPEDYHRLDNAKLRYSLLNQFAKDFEDFDRVERDGFRGLFTISNPDAANLIPSKEVHKRDVFDFYHRSKSIVKDTLQNVQGAIHLSLDGLDSGSKSWAKLSAHYLNQRLEPITMIISVFELESERYTFNGESMLELMKRVCVKEYGIAEKVMAIVCKPNMYYNDRRWPDFFDEEWSEILPHSLCGKSFLPSMGYVLNNLALTVLSGIGCESEFMFECGGDLGDVVCEKCDLKRTPDNTPDADDEDDTLKDIIKLSEVIREPQMKRIWDEEVAFLTKGPQCSIQPPYELPQITNKRWDSYYHLFSSFVRLEVLVGRFVYQSEAQHHPSLDFKGPDGVTIDGWLGLTVDVCSDFLHILEPVYEIIKKYSNFPPGSYATIGDVYTDVSAIQKIVVDRFKDGMSDEAARASVKALGVLFSWTGRIEYQSLPKTAFLLNPYLKLEAIKGQVLFEEQKLAEAAQEAKEIFQSRYSPNNEKKQLTQISKWNKYQLGLKDSLDPVSMLNDFMLSAPSKRPLELTSIGDPAAIRHWSVLYPSKSLKQFAYDILSIPASSSPFEEAFSTYPMQHRIVDTDETEVRVCLESWMSAGLVGFSLFEDMLKEAGAGAAEGEGQRKRQRMT